MNLKKNTGFTLIEVMIVVLIVGVLSSIAFSNYGDSVVNSRRTDARTAILNTATTLEKCVAIYGSYNNAGCSIGNGDSIDSPEKYYTVKVTAAARTFTLTASAVGGKSQDRDTDCTSMTMDNLGAQSGSGAHPETCW